MPRGVEPDLEQEVDRLYGLELDEFTGARDELAKRLRKEGLSDEAAEVKSLRKPTAPAWAVNQLARRHRKDVDLFLDSGHRLREAQAGVLSGASQDDFRLAQETERKALQRLRAAARELGVSDTVLERVSRTLRAAAVTGEGREQLALGRLTVEIDEAGFDALAGMAVTPSRGPARKGVPDAKRRAVKDAEEALHAARTRKRELEREANAAERRAEHARDAATEAAQAVTKAELALERARRR